MKIIINGTPYDLLSSVSDAHMRDLKYLARESRAEGCTVNVPTINAMFIRIGKLMQSDGFTAIDLLADEDFIANIIGTMFLARRKAGEDISLADAGAVSFTDIQITGDDEDEEDEAPKDGAGESSAQLPPTSQD